MKILKLHPLMTISLLQMQFQRVLNCNVTVYIKHSLANAFDTLQEAGLDEADMVEHPIDETLSLREFEEELEEKYNFSLELCKIYSSWASPKLTHRCCPTFWCRTLIRQSPASAHRCNPFTMANQQCAHNCTEPSSVLTIL
jgi:hypothetical protein